LEGELRCLGREIRLGVEAADRAAYESDLVSPDFNEVVRGIAGRMGLDITYGQAAQLWDAWNLGGLTLGRTMFEHVFERMGSDPRETAMVGYSLRADVQAAQSLGMVGVLRKVRKPDPPHEAEQVGEVPADA